jgi:PAS domain S-box-containing protein
VTAAARRWRRLWAGWTGAGRAPVRLPWYGWAVAAGIAACLAIVSWLVVRQSLLIDEALRLQTGRLGIWEVAQLQRQLVRLDGAARLAAQRGSADPDRLRMELDLVLSRIHVLTHGRRAATHDLLEATPDYTGRIAALVGEMDRGFDRFLAQPARNGAPVLAALGEAVTLSQEFSAQYFNDQTLREVRTHQALARLQASVAAGYGAFLVLVLLFAAIVWHTARERLRAVHLMLAERAAGEARLRGLMEVSDEGILVHRGFRPLYANAPFLRLAGRAEDGLPEDARTLIHAEDRPGLLESPAPGADSPPAARLGRMLRAGGADVWIQARTREIDWGSTPAALTTFLDLTERRESELALRQAKDAAESASLAKSRFLASMSHELRTPLTAILGFVQLLLKNVYGPLPERGREALTDMHLSGQHLLALINDVLDISRIESGKVALSFRACDPRECLDGVASRLRVLAQTKQLLLEVDHRQAPERWVYDAQRIAQVLYNLAGNAIKFTDTGLVQVGARRAGDELMFWVSDTGIGIPPAQMDGLFSEFHQANVTLARRESGAGLGLSIAKRIVESHGGRIWGESRAGSGSVFSFALPWRDP